MLGQMLGDGGEGAVESSATAFDELARGAAHALHFFGVFEQVNHFDAGVFGAFDLDGGAGFNKAGGHGGEIFHRRAEDGDFAEGSRFEDIVASGIDERATDEDAVGEAIEGGEFADGIEEEDGDVVGDGVQAIAGVRGATGTGKREFRAADEFTMGLFDEIGGEGETLGLAGSEDEQSFWKIALDHAEDEEGERLFGGDDAAGYDEGAAAATGAFFFEPFGEGGGRGQFEVVFQIAADRDFFGWGTEGADAVGVRLGLHEEGGCVAEGGLQERLQEEAECAEITLPAGEGAIGNAAADEKDGDFATAGFAKEVGPDFGFEDDDGGGFDGLDDAADAEGPVEREIDYGIGEGHALFSESVTGKGGGGDDERALRVGVFQAAGEGDAGEGFADGDGVNPDGAWMLGGEFFESRNGKAEALAEIGEIFAVAEALDQPIGRCQQGGKTHQYAIEEIHSM